MEFVSKLLLFLCLIVGHSKEESTTGGEGHFSSLRHNCETLMIATAASVPLLGRREKHSNGVSGLERKACQKDNALPPNEN